MIDKYKEKMNLIKARIILYRERKLTLSDLHKDLESLLNNIQDISPHLKDELQMHCNELDVAYAVSKEMKIPIHEFESEIKAACHSMEEIIDKLLLSA